MDKMPILFGVPDPQWHRNIIDHNKCLNVICTRLKWNHEYLGMFFKKFNYFLYLSVLLWTMLIIDHNKCLNIIRARLKWNHE